MLYHDIDEMMINHVVHAELYEETRGMRIFLYSILYGGSCRKHLFCEYGILLQVLCCTLGQIYSGVCKANTMASVEHSDVTVNCAELLPFYSLTDYNVESEFISAKRKFVNLINNEKFETFLKENKYEQIFNPSSMIPCQYFDGEEFIKKNRTDDECLNIFSLNIRSLPKHGGELLQFLKDLNTRFDVIVLTEIGAKNVSVVDKLIPDYNFHYILPTKSKCGGVGIYTSKALTNIAVKDDIKIGKSCDCVKCETESLFIDFCYRGKCLKEAEINYYEESFDNHKNSVYDLWKSLNPIINHKRGKSFSPVNKSMIGRKAIVDKQEISNSMH